MNVNKYKPIGYSSETAVFQQTKVLTSQQESMILMRILQCSETEMWAMIRDQDCSMSNLLNTEDFPNIC